MLWNNTLNNSSLTNIACVFFGNLLGIFPVTKFLFLQNLVTIGLGEGVGVAEMVVNGSRGFKITGSGMSRGTAPSITLRHFVASCIVGNGCVSNCQDIIKRNLRGKG